jgi:hypothetical protein
MKAIHIFDQALCCSTGVCGVEVDQSLVDFAADVDWATKGGVMIVRHNLASEPMTFVDNPVVKGFLERSGADALPLTLVDDEIALAGRYPGRAELARWAGLTSPENAPDKAPTTACCAPRGCCS